MPPQRLWALGLPPHTFLKSLSPTLRLYLDLAVRCHHLALTLRLCFLYSYIRDSGPPCCRVSRPLHWVYTAQPPWSCSPSLAVTLYPSSFPSYHQGALNVTAAISAPLVYFVSPQSWVTYTRGVLYYGQRGSVMKQVSGNDPGQGRDGLFIFSDVFLSK